MVDELKEKFGDNLNVQLHKGEKGIFDVKRDGELIYSKFKTDRFPNEGEIAELLS